MGWLKGGCTQAIVRPPHKKDAPLPSFLRPPSQAEFVMHAPANIAATITPQHMMLNRNALFAKVSATVDSENGRQLGMHLPPCPAARCPSGPFPAMRCPNMDSGASYVNNADVVMSATHSA